MNENSPNPQNEPAWLRFEKEVAKLFELFGYDDVVHNTKTQAGQSDIIAKSRKSSKANILVECKYHQDASSNVGIKDVEKFINRVRNHRHDGIIDRGYLVTNTGFTAPAKSAIDDNMGNYLFLLTYDELIQNLLDINRYLREFIAEYDKEGEGRRYVEMKLINTTVLDRTILDSLPGDLIKIEEANQSYLVIPQSYIDKELNGFTFLDYETDAVSPSVDPTHFVLNLKEYYLAEIKAQSEYEGQLIERLSEAVHEVAVSNNDDMLHPLMKSLRKKTLDMISWSAEAVIASLLDNWQELGGDSYRRTYKKADFRKRIQREIINKYKLKISTVSFKKAEVPPFISTFWAHVLDALKIRPGEMSELKEPEKKGIWTVKDEFENILMHLESNIKKSPQLKLLFEEMALPVLDRYITSGTSNTLVLIGDYGAGKTTILRRLMRKLAEDKLARQQDPACRIPLYITLKDYNIYPGINNLIRMFLQNTVEVDNVSIRTFKQLNEEGRFVLLLDAFDEMLTRVTRADRRRCFQEIAELVSKKSRIVLTGRPSYFNDYKEFKENLEFLRKVNIGDNGLFSNEYEVMCLQLLDEDQVEELIKKASPADSKTTLDILLNRPNLMDLARRPVLASMIAQTGKELVELGSQKITARSIYEIYTNRWIKREENKGEFRLLIHADQRSTFMRYLAMQMHISGSLKIHYAELDRAVAQYFKLDTLKDIDYFSNDIHTCSFLSRTDDGYYFFIHKSFMEYFVACEFEQQEKSPFADEFSNNLTNEIIDLLNLELLPDIFSNLGTIREDWVKCIEAVKVEKNKVVKIQKFDTAGYYRDIEKEFEEIIEQYNSFYTMKYNPENHMLSRLKNAIEIDRKYVEVTTDEIQNIKAIINSHLRYFGEV